MSYDLDLHVPLTLRATIFPSGVTMAANGDIETGGSAAGTIAPTAAAEGDAELDEGDGVDVDEGGATRFGGNGGLANWEASSGGTRGGCCCCGGMARGRISAPPPLTGIGIAPAGGDLGAGLGGRLPRPSPSDILRPPRPRPFIILIGTAPTW